MSHYSHIVLVPKDEVNVLETIGELMSPYDENDEHLYRYHKVKCFNNDRDPEHKRCRCKGRKYRYINSNPKGKYDYYEVDGKGIDPTGAIIDIGRNKFNTPYSILTPNGKWFQWEKDLGSLKGKTYSDGEWDKLVINLFLKHKDCFIWMIDFHN